MRVLLTLHHVLDPNLGAPGVTLALAKALEERGCEVTTYGFAEAWPGMETASIRHAVLFPYKAAAYISRHRRQFEILDMSTGDAHWWPVAKRLYRQRPALVTRSHGLEHVADERRRRDAARGAIRLSRRYGVYHGGLRLSEVARSLRSSDAAIALNHADRAYLIDKLGLSGDRVTVIPNGVHRSFLDAPIEKQQAGPLRIVWIARWEPGKGSLEMIEALERLAAARVDFHLLMLGTGLAKQEMASLFSAEVMERIDVAPQFANADLPRLLADRDVFVFPSHSEGFSVALVEAMALGVTPLATPVGGVPELIEPGVNGCVVPSYDGTALADAVVRMAAERDWTAAMGLQARETARGYSWQVVAERTIDWYEHARSLMASPPGPIAGARRKGRR